MNTRITLPALAAAAMLILSPAALAHTAPVALDEPILVAPTLNLNLAAAYAQPETPPAAPASGGQPVSAQTSERSRNYGEAGSRWWTIGAAWSHDFSEADDINIHGAWSQFLADDFEFVIEAALWYFSQKGDDTAGFSGSFLLRWHPFHADDYSWSIFADAGIGLLGAFDEVPDGGTGFNFLPRLGGGLTLDLDSSDGPRSGARLMVGLRWHHISNGRIAGDSSNPARDALCGYIGITFPF